MNLKYCVLLIILLISPGLTASPRIISDNRIEDLNGFPTLGRGYSMNSNTLQSMCFKSVQKSKPTFDLNYDIEEITDEYLKKLLISDKNRIQNTRLNVFINKYYQTGEVSENKKYTLKNLIVKVEVNQYYYSMDETHSNLSESVKELLKKKQYVTFFNSCGHFYIRSVGTFSTYYALLQYRLTGEGYDEFRGNLEKGLFNFYEENGGTPAVLKPDPSKKGKKNSIGNPDSSKLRDDSKFRGLKVYVQGIGLSTGNPVNLIPVNISQFRKTVQEAVKLMQAPDAGLVSSIEVVPWMENPEFGNILLNAENQGGRQFIKQQRIEENTGVITEIYRKSKQQLELYNISSMCRRVIVDHYADKSEGSLYRSLFGQGIIIKEKKKEFTLMDPMIIRQLIDKKIRKYDGNRTVFFNLSNENDSNGYITLNDYIKYFHGNPPERFLEINRNYLNGENDDGALDCINKLYDKIDEISYRNVPSCVRALRNVELSSTFVNQYCLPKPVKVVYEGEPVVKSGGKKNLEKGSSVNVIKDSGQKGIIKSFKDINKGNIGENEEKDEKEVKEKKSAEKSGSKEKINSFDDMLEK